MGYYNWEEIIPNKTDSELKAIIRDRSFCDEAILIAENELKLRNDPIFINRYEEIKNLHRDRLIKPRIIYQGNCPICKSNSKFLLTFEKGPRIKISPFYIYIMGITFLLTWRETLNFLRLRKNRDGKIGTCMGCGKTMIQCKQCKNIHLCNDDHQICTKCNRRIDKPEKK